MQPVHCTIQFAYPFYWMYAILHSVLAPWYNLGISPFNPYTVLNSSLWSNINLTSAMLHVTHPHQSVHCVCTLVQFTTQRIFIRTSTLIWAMLHSIWEMLPIIYKSQLNLVRPLHFFQLESHFPYPSQSWNATFNPYSVLTLQNSTCLM